MKRAKSIFLWCGEQGTQWRGEKSRTFYKEAGSADDGKNRKDVGCFR